MAASEPFEPDVTKWDAWRPEEVARRLVDVQAPWYVAAGWAIDLLLGGHHREHEDLEISIPAGALGEFVEALAGFEIFVVGVPAQGLLTAVEHVDDAALADTHQTWVREPATGLWRLDMFREIADGETWICRRDARIRLPYSDVITWTEDGIPYGRPEIVLLYKAKHAHRERDQADFEAAMLLLEPDRRRWLAEAIALVHPGHPWLAALA